MKRWYTSWRVRLAVETVLFVLGFGAAGVGLYFLLVMLKPYWGG